MKQEIVQETMKATPPVTVSAALVLGGLTLNDWVLIATLIYIALQGGHLLWKWWKEAKRSRK